MKHPLPPGPVSHWPWKIDFLGPHRPPKVSNLSLFFAGQPLLILDCTASSALPLQATGLPLGSPGPIPALGCWDLSVLSTNLRVPESRHTLFKSPALWFLAPALGSPLFVCRQFQGLQKSQVQQERA